MLWGFCLIKRQSSQVSSQRALSQLAHFAAQWKFPFHYSVWPLLTLKKKHVNAQQMSDVRKTPRRV